MQYEERKGISMARFAEINRKTKETDVRIRLWLEGGEVSVMTGIGFFDHMLTALLFYAGFGAKISVKGDLHVDAHHTVEDTGLCLGMALLEALGDKQGVGRFASAFVPMDEALCHTALDLSGRPYLHFDAPMPQERIGEYDACLTQEFLRAFANTSKTTLHCRALYGDNAHHITEALFKSLGLALKQACEIRSTGVVSTKGALE